MLDRILLDSRLSIRMLAKHRGLSIVGVFAMAVAIAVGATLFEVFAELTNPALPFTGGDRVVALQFTGTAAGRPERHVIHDFAALKGHLNTVQHFGAYRNIEHNLVAPETAPEPVTVAEISASAFAIAGIAPSHGRHLSPDDESPSAPAVVVIGDAPWRIRFAADPNVVGRTINLGGVPRTIVGVMPAGFKFPTDHDFWVPLRESPDKYPRWEGPLIYMFGRLAPEATIDQASAEFAAVAQRTAVPFPDTGRTLIPVVVPFTNGFVEPGMLWAMRLGQLLVGALTFVVAINLAILVYARTVTRLGELAVRSALGASRARILAQLFTEALGLCAVGAGAGLILARYALGVIQALSQTNGMPFWLNFDLSAGAVFYAIGLAVLGALIMGVIPGLKATGSRVNANLNELHGRTGTRLGATWTTLIVAQVAVAVAVLPAAVFITQRVMRMEMTGAGFDAESFVVARADFTPENSSVDAGYVRARQSDLISRLKAEPGVAGVTFSSSIPGFGGSYEIRFEDGVQVRQGAEHVPDVGITDALYPSSIRAGIDLFDTYEIPILAGRDFMASDINTPHVVVNRSFAAMYLPDANAVGLRFRYARDGAAGAWFQIIGVVRDFPAFPPNLTRSGEPTIYHPAAAGDMNPVVLSVRFLGEVPPASINRFRAIGAEVDPVMQLRDTRVLGDFYGEGRKAWRSMAYAVALVTASVLLLSAAGIYALMSFTVARRRREIGIRTALGAQPGRLILDVLGRAGWQIAGGVMVGSLLSAGGFVALGLGVAAATPLLLTVAAMMSLVGLLAALGPARRGLRIQAVEALKAEG